MSDQFRAYDHHLCEAGVRGVECDPDPAVGDCKILRAACSSVLKSSGAVSTSGGCALPALLRTLVLALAVINR